MDSKVSIIIIILLIAAALYFFLSGREARDSAPAEAPEEPDIVTEASGVDLMGVEIAVPEEPGVKFTITADGFINDSDFTHTGSYPTAPDGSETDEFFAYVDRASVRVGERYMYVFTAFNFGGSGNFGYLTAIDRETKKSVVAVSLGDRVKFHDITIAPIAESESEEVQVVYVKREDGMVGPEAYAGEPTTEHFEVFFDGRVRGARETVLEEIRVQRSQ